jgi:site-specific DNA recombinase
MKAVVYGRVSKDDDSQDYGRQLHELQVYASRNDYEIIKEFTERVSGAKEQRQQLELMLQYVRKNGIKNILVTELSRFGRLGHKTRTQIEELAAEGVNMFFKDKGLNTLKNGKRDDTNMMVIGILCDIAEQELITLKNRIVSGLIYSAKNNGAQSGKYRAYGFQSVDKKLEVDPEEMKLVKLIFDLYRSGLGCSQIANHLNSKGVLTRFNKVLGENETITKGKEVKKGTDFTWSSGTIATLLKNKLYKGERWHSNQLVSTFEPPINPHVFDQVQLLMKNKNNKPIRTIKNDNHLKGIIKCGVCGQPYYLHQRKDGHDFAYKCLSKKLKYDGKMKYCGSPSINITKLLDSLYSVGARMIITKLRTSKPNQLMETENKIASKKIEVDLVKKELKKFESRIENLYDDYNDRVLTKERYLTKKTGFEETVSKLQDQLDKLVADIKYLDDIKKKPIRDHYTREIFLREIRNIIKNVTVSDIKPTPKNSIKRVFGDRSTPIKIVVESVHGEKITYVLSRYTDKVVFFGEGNTKLNTRLKKEPFKGAYETFYSFEQTIHKLIKDKMKKAA